MLSLTINGRDLSQVADTYSFSNVSRGGFEQAQIQLSNNVPVERGDEVLIFEGLTVAWHGYIDSPGDVSRDGRTRTNIVALGYGTHLKENTGMMNFLDADLNSWTQPTLLRQYNLGNTSYGLVNFTVESDPGNGFPAITMPILGSWTTALPVCEAWYDNKGMPIGGMLGYTLFGAMVNRADVNWHANAGICSIPWDPNGSPTATAYNLEDLTSSNPSPWSMSNSAPGSTYAFLQWYYSLTSAGEQNKTYGTYWTVLVYGAHGIPLRSDGPDNGTAGIYINRGLQASDVISWVLRNSGFGCNLHIDTSDSYLIRHLVYKSMTTWEQMITDSAQFTGYVWGTWEPQSMLSSVPTFRYEPAPTRATCQVSLFDCDDIDEPVVSLSNSYNTATVSYKDAAGVSYNTRVTLGNPVLTAAGISRTLNLEMPGISSANAATTYGLFALKLSQATQRGGGSVTLTSDVRNSYDGSPRPASLIRAGRDRIRIPELNDGDVFLDDDRAANTFLVERVETTVTNGRAQTQVEFDTGGDLMEVINARLTAELTAANVN